MNRLMLVCALIIVAAVLPDKKSVRTVPLPAGFTRVKADPGSWQEWLRNLSLKEDNTVYLFNREKKRNQSAQYAVLDVPIGNRDLQQCADAVIRLRAEYLFAQKRFDQIAFHGTDGTLIDYASWRKGYRFKLVKGKLKKFLTNSPGDGRDSFERYLELVFTYAGTLSLSKELVPTGMKDVRAGDVFIKGGSPGHAVIVTDIAVNQKGEKIFLLAQSYMPAQDIHLLINPSSPNGTPWYDVNADGPLVTPEWTFLRTQLARFP